MKRNYVKRLLALMTAGVMVTAIPTVYYADEREEAVTVEIEEKEEPKTEELIEPAACTEQAAPAPVQEAPVPEAPVQEEHHEAAAEETAQTAEHHETETVSDAEPQAVGEEAVHQETPAPESAAAAETVSAIGSEATAENPEETEAAAEAEAEASEETEETEEPEETEEETVQQFAGFVHIELAGGALREGEAATLVCKASETDLSHSVRWEVRSGDSWSAVAENSSEYSFIADENNADFTYRAVLVFAEEGIMDVVSNELKLPGLVSDGQEEAEEIIEIFDEPEMSVSISSSATDSMQEGETVVLTGTVSGFDGYEVMYQWTCNKGNGFEIVYGANSSTYSFTATQESLGWEWELEVYYR